LMLTILDHWDSTGSRIAKPTLVTFPEAPAQVSLCLNLGCGKIGPAAPFLTLVIQSVIFFQSSAVAYVLFVFLGHFFLICQIRTCNFTRSRYE
jgi:hypothetical protein